MSLVWGPARRNRPHGLFLGWRRHGFVRLPIHKRAARIFRQLLKSASPPAVGRTARSSLPGHLVAGRRPPGLQLGPIRSSLQSHGRDSARSYGRLVELCRRVYRSARACNAEWILPGTYLGETKACQVRGDFSQGASKANATRASSAFAATCGGVPASTKNRRIASRARASPFSGSERRHSRAWTMLHLKSAIAQVPWVQRYLRPSFHSRSSTS